MVVVPVVDAYLPYPIPATPIHVILPQDSKPLHEESPHEEISLPNLRFICHDFLSGWWFGTFFIFPSIGNFIIPIDFHSFFQRGRVQPPTSYDFEVFKKDDVEGQHFFPDFPVGSCR